MINTASTISIEAAALDKPIINLAFDMKKVNYWASTKRFYDFEHYQPVISSGAVKLARSREELLEMTLHYLDKPHLEKDERAKLRDMMCYKLDGLSAQRVAEHVLSLIDGEDFHSSPN